MVLLNHWDIFGICKWFQIPFQLFDPFWNYCSVLFVWNSNSVRISLSLSLFITRWFSPSLSCVCFVSLSIFHFLFAIWFLDWFGFVESLSDRGDHLSWFALFIQYRTAINVYQCVCHLLFLGHFRCLVLLLCLFWSLLNSYRQNGVCLLRSVFLIIIHCSITCYHYHYHHPFLWLFPYRIYTVCVFICFLWACLSRCGTFQPWFVWEQSMRLLDDCSFMHCAKVMAFVYILF